MDVDDDDDDDNDDDDVVTSHPPIIFFVETDTRKQHQQLEFSGVLIFFENSFIYELPYYSFLVQLKMFLLKSNEPLISILQGAPLRS